MDFDINTEYNNLNKNPGYVLSVRDNEIVELDGKKFRAEIFTEMMSLVLLDEHGRPAPSILVPHLYDMSHVRALDGPIGTALFTRVKLMDLLTSGEYRIG